MFKRFNPTALISVWIAAFTAFALFGPPATSGLSVFMLILGGLVSPTIMLVLWQSRQTPTIAEVLHQVEASPDRRQ